MEEEEARLQVPKDTQTDSEVEEEISTVEADGVEKVVKTQALDMVVVEVQLLLQMHKEMDSWVDVELVTRQVPELL